MIAQAAWSIRKTAEKWRFFARFHFVIAARLLGIGTEYLTLRKMSLPVRNNHADIKGQHGEIVPYPGKDETGGSKSIWMSILCHRLGGGCCPTLPLVQTNLTEENITSLAISLAPKLSQMTVEQMTVPANGTYGSMTGMGNRTLYAVNFETDAGIPQDTLYGEIAK